MTELMTMLSRETTASVANGLLTYGGRVYATIHGLTPETAAEVCEREAAIPCWSHLPKGHRFVIERFPDPRATIFVCIRCTLFVPASTPNVKPTPPPTPPATYFDGSERA